jgi:hypothetical protein
MTSHDHVEEALLVLAALGMPAAQQNERSALCLLALLDLTPDRPWSQARDPLMGITPIMDWLRTHYAKEYAPNTRETVRRQSIHQFMAAGLVRQNPDDHSRAVNSPKNVYQIDPSALVLLRSYGTPNWPDALAAYLATHPKLIAKYARARDANSIPVQIAPGRAISLTPGAHSKLIKAIIDDFAPRFAPNSRLVYVGDTGDKWAYCDDELLSDLGADIDVHGKMPDVALYLMERNWLFLIEAVTSHGPVNPQRHAELASVFSGVRSGLVYVTAFPNRATMSRYIADIAWETEVWVADAPSHLIHFDGTKLLGPYQ